MNKKIIDTTKLTEALNLINEQMILNDYPKVELVVCGGAALIALGLVARTTRDIDIIALVDAGKLKDSEPLPEYLVEATSKVGEIMKLPQDWFNNGPASQFRLGLPKGMQERLHSVVIGDKLNVHYISREDQIFFKVYASADRGGYHVDDLKALNPSDEELIAAGRWCMEQDVSESFRAILIDMFTQLGWSYVSATL